VHLTTDRHLVLTLKVQLCPYSATRLGSLALNKSEADVAMSCVDLRAVVRNGHECVVSINYNASIKAGISHSFISTQD
jgi:hypothetical protein